MPLPLLLQMKQDMIDSVREYCLKKGYARHVIAGGLEGIVADWERTVAETVEGYRLEFEDYLNDMDGRSILEEVLAVASEEQKQNVQARIGSADALFVAHTVSSSQCVWGEHTEAKHGYSREKDWWYYRVPKKWAAHGL